MERTAKCKQQFAEMKFNFLKSKTFYTTIGSVSVISSIGYFGQSFVSKYNAFNKNPIKSVYFDENKDYIYLNEDMSDFSSSADNSSDYKSTSSRSHLQLLGLAQYRRDTLIRELAITAIANTQFNDYEYRELAQTCDFATAVRLARIPDISSKLFLPPIKTNFIKLNDNSVHSFDFEKVLLNLLKKAQISGNECSECTKYFTQMSIDMLESGGHSHNSIDFTDIHDSTRHKKLIVPDVDWIYLQSITQNILCGKTQCKTLADNGLFLVLHYLRNNFSDMNVNDWIAQTLANLSAHKELHLHFWYSRWFSTLVQWLHSERLESSLSAAKVFYNLSEETGDYLFPQSMYLLYPIFDDKSNKDFDIVLIHGLLGGVFKTWRQCDSEKQTKSYTRCWPQKWLTNDIQNIRVLAVNYQTFLSNWNIECQDNNSILTLRQRSSQLLNDLIASKVGDKPIVWITHSMGGLLLKQMLLDIHESNDQNLKSILNQTKGIVFYSVPHLGTEMAVWSPRIQRIISPSSELLELRKDSKLLLSIHKRFVKLIENKSIECLSFGETVKSTVIKRPFKWSRLLVTEDSANPGVGRFHSLPVDHFNTCKPKSKSSEAYYRTRDFIKNIIQSNEDINDGKRDNISILLSMFS